MSNQSKDQTIFQHMEQEKRILWGSFDEVVPVLAVAPLLFICHQPYIGMIVAIGWTVLVKWLKKGHGSKYLSIMLYWFAPSLRIKTKLGVRYFGILQTTPPAERIQWI